jgi:hypothetical protein
MRKSNHLPVLAAVAWLWLGLLPAAASAVTFCNPEFMPPGACQPYDHMLGRQKQREQMMHEQRTRIWSPEQWQDFVRSAKEYDQRKSEEARQKSERWDFHQSASDDAVKSCQATFLGVRQGVMFLNMEGGTKGTFIGFFGNGVPRPGKPEQVKVSLTQSGETQTVQAYHLYLPWDGSFGAILFAIPSTKALLESIEDEQDFAVAMNGKTLVSGKWRGGLKARDWLRDCVRKR